ncbi:hypothetical protein EKH83_07335 [Arcticibacter tournemirensis]|uniref:Uncharacterized protein n=1 Tax=Arcticibacter tournemirensis TaxID=699437 RepID=A0A4Q0MB04_9SPHI|nr:hypothetical protein EKH83_07335 [Arcticibacter tournemirensis]
MKKAAGSVNGRSVTAKRHKRFDYAGMKKRPQVCLRQTSECSILFFIVFIEDIMVFYFGEEVAD